MDVVPLITFQDVEPFLRLLVATVLGAAVGYERERADKPAGFRTHALVCLGTSLFTVASMTGFGPTADPSRIAAGIVTGIGFLGAGTILRTEGAVIGLTTAASIWTVAAVGLAVGAGMYLLGLVATLIVIGILRFPQTVR